MPDLLFPRGKAQGRFIGADAFADPAYEGDGWERDDIGEETDEEYRERQITAVKTFIEKMLKVPKGTTMRPVVCIRPMAEFISDILSLRSRRVILWKPRGGGGSLSASILIFLLAVYRQMSTLDIAGGEEQAKVVYDYTKNFWYCIPGLVQGLLLVEPGVKETKLKTGVIIKAVPSTDKQVRGKHLPVLVSDETCQAKANSLDTDDKTIRAALQTVLSETDSIVVMLSTFHVPGGVFQEFWDNAELKGFKRYKWNVFHTMQPCSRGLSETVTADSEEAKLYCRQCFLTRRHEETDEKGRKQQIGWAGCNGQARKSAGWALFDEISEAKKINVGTMVFPVEFECERPNVSGSIYIPELVDDALVDPLTDYKQYVIETVVGVDWGSETENSLCLLVVLRLPEFLYVADGLYADHQSTGYVVQSLFDIYEKYGSFRVLADRSHMFCVRDVANSGIPITPVDFRTYKAPGIQNLAKYFTFRRIKINKDCQLLIQQLKAYRRRGDGSILKANDHGPDALLSGCLYWKFEDIFEGEVDRADLIPEKDELDAAWNEAAEKYYARPDKKSGMPVIDRETLIPNFPSQADSSHIPALATPAAVMRAQMAKLMKATQMKAPTNGVASRPMSWTPPVPNTPTIPANLLQKLVGQDKLLQ